MNFGVYVPPQFKADGGDKLPVIYYLSGLTCTEQNVVTKGGAQQYAAKHGIIFVAPDTSPSKYLLTFQFKFYSMINGTEKKRYHLLTY